MHFRKKKSKLAYILFKSYLERKEGRKAGGKQAGRKAGSKELRRGSYEFSVAKILERKKPEEGKQCV